MDRVVVTILCLEPVCALPEPRVAAADAVLVDQRIITLIAVDGAILIDERLQILEA